MTLSLATMPGVVGAAVNPNADVEPLVRAAFADAPDMIAVAKCESGFRQYADSGEVLHGGGGGKYIGIFQISEAVHLSEATRLGDDIMTTAGNIAYARHLYDREGTTPWVSCLPKKPPVAEASADTTPVPVTNRASDVPRLTVNLRLGMTHPQMKLLQRLLNGAGYAISAGGPGSAGNETEYFGALSRAAVRKFQCAKGIACGGDEASTGYGRVGATTRAALNALAAR